MDIIDVIVEYQLTPRLLEILKLMAHGMSNEDLCYELNLSYSTVKGNIQNLYKKLHVSDDRQAIAFYYKYLTGKISDVGPG